MVNKRGWLRVVEASIAVLIIIGAILTISKTRVSQDNNELNEQLIFALDNIAENSTVRDYILNYNVVEAADNPINSPLVDKINESLYSQFPGIKPKILFKICLANEPCVISSGSNGEILSYDRIIATSENSLEFSPKKIKVIAW